MILPTLTSPASGPYQVCFDFSSQQQSEIEELNAVPFMNYCIEKGVINSSIAPFNFVHNFFESSSESFSTNQAVLIALSAELFASSVPLGDHESAVLGGTLKRLVKSHASLPGRK